MTDHLTISPRIQKAHEGGRAIVALESTIITHGMPHPRNVEVALRVEEIVREEGAEPATIAVLDGELIIGLSTEQIEELGRAKDVRKLSSADLAHAVIAGSHGSTTVAATMAAMTAGGMIQVFATGGIGGVHRGAETSFDMSADLDALAHSNLIVVCAGPKAILDVPLTLEALETRGVPVVALGTDHLPTFWSRDGDIAAPLRLETPEQIARTFALRRAYRQDGSMLVAVPVPESAAIPSAEIAEAIENALAAAERENITGKSVTPFLLSRMFDETGGRSLETNIALIENNARTAARIAVALG